MIGRLFGAFFRTFLVGVLLALTVSMMPDVRPGTLDGFGLVMIAMCVLVLVEYGFQQPALLEFRFAPPYNRWRFLSLMAIIFGLVTLCDHIATPTRLSTCVNWLADFAEGLFTFRGSPAVYMEYLLEDEVTQKASTMVTEMAALGYLVSFVSSFGFLLYIAVSRWPARPNMQFHFWSNLPTFQTVQPENATQRLFQFGILSIGMAFVFPYAIPYFIQNFLDLLPQNGFIADFTLFWMISLTTWLPLVCLMRGLALIKVSRLILHDQMDGVRVDP